MQTESNSSHGTKAITLAGSILCLCGALLLQGVVAGAVIPATVPYGTDFESGVGPEWSMPNWDGATAGPFTHFTGRLGNQDQTLSLTNLVVGRSYTVFFDLYIFDSWDGSNPGAGPDWVNVHVDGNQIFHYTFNNFSGTQSYPGVPDVGPYDMGFSGWPDSIYRSIEITFIAANTTAQITFQGQGLEDLNNESWGIDNVGVTLTSAMTSTAIVGTSLPTAGAVSTVAWDRFTVLANRNLLGSTAGNAASYLLRDAGANGVLGDSDDTIYTLVPTVASFKSVSFFINNGPLQPGLYRFETTSAVLDNSSNAVALFSRAFTVANPVAGQIENTHNNTLPEATTLPLTESPTGSGFFTALAEGAFASAGDVDYWRFEALSNDCVSVRLETEVGGVYPQVYLANAADQNLTSVGGDSWSAQFFNYRFAAAGSYYLRVYNNNIPARYHLRLDLGRTVQLESESNDSQGYANPLTVSWNGVLGQARFRIAGALPSPDSAGDYFGLGFLNAGNAINMTLTLPGCSTLVTTGVVLTVESAGNSVALATNNSGALSCTITADGVYYVRIQSPTGLGLRAQYLLNVAVTDSVAPYIVGSTLPAEGTTTGGVFDRFSMTFSEDLDYTTVTNPAAYELRSAGPDGVMGNGDDVLYQVQSMGYAAGTAASYWVGDGPLQAGSYQFTVGGLKDRAGNLVSPVFVQHFAILDGLYIMEGRTNGNRATATSLSRLGTNGLPDGTFTQWGGYGMGQFNGNNPSPYYLAKGDLNGDGVDDLVSANWSSQSVTVFLGNRDGTFQSGTNFYAGDNPCYVVVGDVNGDGKADVVVANYYWNNVTVLLGNGDGTLQSRLGYGTAGNPRTLALADLNGDGKMDIVTGNEGGWCLSVLLGKGNGDFHGATNYGLPTSGWGVAVADVDGDGKLDLVGAGYGGSSVTLFSGNGDGTFAWKTNLTVGSRPRTVRIGDMNGDGLADVVVLNADSRTVSVLRGLGGGTFASATNFSYGGSDAYDMILADLNQDGRPDVAVAVYGDSWLGVMLNNGDGTLAPTTGYGIGGNPFSVVAGDFNRDGITDLAMVNINWHAMYVWWGGRSEILTEDPSGSGLRSGFGRGNLKNTSDYDYWSFTGQAGDILTVAAEVPGNPNCSQLYYRVERTDGNASGVMDFYTDGSGWGQCRPTSLPITGRYTVYVRYNCDYQGPYQIRVTLAPPTLQVETEDNGSQGNANGLAWTTNNPQTAVVAGYVSVGDGGGDWYALGNLAFGTTITLGLRQPSSSGLVPVMDILQGGTVVTSSVPMSTTLVFPVQTSGAYYARIYAVSNSAGLASQYILNLSLMDTVPPYVTSDNLPAEGTTTGGLVDRFDLGFSEEMKPETVNAVGSYDLRGAGPDGVIGTSDDPVYTVQCTGYGSGLSASYRLPDGPLRPDTYRLRVTGVRDRAGNLISPIHERNFSVVGVAGYIFEGRTNGGRGLATSLGTLTTNADGSFTQWGGYGMGQYNGNNPSPYYLAKGDLNGDGIDDLVSANWSSQSVTVFLGNGDGTFQPGTNFYAGDYPCYVVVGDVNGDGKADVIVANYYWNNVAVLLGNGDGTLQPRLGYGTAGNPRTIALADLNGDGKMDIVTGNEGGWCLSVLLGQGDGGFHAATNYGLPTSGWGVAVADVDGDGKLDLVGAGYGSSTVTLFSGNGDGTFAWKTNLAVASRPRAVRIGDMNGDGVADLVVLNADSRSVSVLRGLGGGTFASATNFSYGGSDAYDMILADLNQDGRLDVAVAVYGDSWLGVMLNNGDGTLAPAIGYGIGGNPISVVAGDFNRDGITDLAMVNISWHAMYVWFGDHVEMLTEDPPSSGLRSGYGRGNLKDTSDYDYWSFSGQAGDVLTFAADVPGNPYCSSLYYRLERTDGNASYLTGYTTDGSGWGQSSPVTLPATGRYTIYVRYNCDYQGEYRIRVTLARPPMQMESEDNSSRGNANGLAWTTNNPQTATVAGYISVGDGSGDWYALGNLAFGTTITLGLSQPIRSGLIPVMDILQNGTVVTSTVPYGISLVYPVQSSGAYYARVYAVSNSAGLESQYILNLSLGDTVPPYITSDSLPAEGTVSSAVLDRFDLGFSEEMKPETVVAGTHYDLRSSGPDGVMDTADDAIYAVQCTGYSSGLGASYRMPDGPLQPGVYRLRVSGLQDRAGNLLTPMHERNFSVAGITGYTLESRTNAGRSVATSLGTMTSAVDGSLTQSGGYGMGTFNGNNPSPFSVAKGDFNGDGIDDLVSANWSSQSVTVFLGNGDGTFQSGTNFYAGDYPCYVVVGDVNGDGKADVVVANYYWNNVAVLLGNGDGTLQPRLGYGVAANPRTVALADLNGDGNLDIVTGNENGWNLSVLLGKGDGSFQGATNYGLPTTGWGVAVADVDGDGKLDLVGAGYGSSTVTIFKGNGDGTFTWNTNLTVGSRPRIVRIADMDGDGVADLVVMNQDSRNVSVLRGLGGGMFAPALNYSYGGSDAYEMILADLNRDGRPDVVVAVYGDSWLGVMMNQGDGTLATTTGYGIGGNPIGVAAGDFNRDGALDLATVNINWHALYLWFGNHVEMLTEDPPGSGLRSGYGRGNLKDTGDYDYWSFSGQAGDVVTFAADVPGNPYCSSLYYRLERTDGNASYLTGYTTDGGGWGQSSPVTLPATGRYTVYARYNCDYQGEYRIRLTLARPPMQMESEDNSSRGNANGLAWTTNNPQQAMVAGYISVGDGGGDWYSLGNLALGTTITLGLSQPARSGLIPVMDIIQGGTVVTSTVPSGTSLVYPVRSSDAYYARVYAVSNSAGLESQYILSLSLNDTVPPYITSDNLPAEGITSSGVWDRFDLGFSEEMKADTVVNGANYELRAAGPDGILGTGDDVIYTVQCTGYSSGLGASYRLLDGPLQPGAYRLRVRGLQDRAGNQLFPMHERNFTVVGVAGYVLEGRTNGGRGIATSLGTLTSAVDGSFTQSGGYGMGTFNGNNPYPQSLAKGDFNGDGIDDLVSGNWGSHSVTVFLGNGDGTFQPGTNFYAGDYPHYLVVGDVNGDGKADVVVVNYYWNNVSVLLGNGDGTLQPRAGYGVGANPRTLALADLNGDGKLDIVTANENGWSLSVLLGKGDGSFHGATNYGLPTTAWGVAIGDLDGDGKPDLVGTGYGGNTVTIFKGNGDGTFAWSTNLTVGNRPRIVRVADMDGDGVTDVVVVNNDSRNVSVLRGMGGGLFAPAVNYSHGGGDVYDMLATDLNHDGRPDVVVPIYGDSWMAVMMNQGDGTLGPTIGYGMGGNPIGVAAGDFNGDGATDLATVNYNWQAFYLWWGNHVEALAEDPPGSNVRTGLGRGNLKDTGDYDYWSFSGQAGDLLTIAADVPGNPGNSSLYYRLERTDANASYINGWTTDGNGRGLFGPLALPMTGRYTLYVRYNNDFQGEYRFRTTLVHPPMRSESEDNSSISPANILSFTTNAPNRSSAVAGAIWGPGDRDYYNLGTLTNGQTIILSTRLPSTSHLLPSVSVHNALDFYMQESGNGRPLDGVAQVQISDPGTYYAVVEAAEGTSGLDAQYLLNVLVSPTGATNFANLFVTSVTPPADSGLQSGHPITFSYAIQNAGAQPTPATQWSDRVVLSANRILGDGDDVLLGVFPHYGVLAAGATYTSNQTVRLPEGLSGDFYLLVETDTYNNVDEGFFEADNVGVSSTTFHVSMGTYPDLKIENDSVTGPDAQNAFTVAWTTANRGLGAANGGFKERLFVQHQQSGLVLTNVELAVTSDLAPNGTVGRSALVTASLPGSYQVVLTTDSRNNFFEFDGVSHTSAEQNLVQTNFVITLDLVVNHLRLDPEAGLQSGSNTVIRWDDVNTGDHAAGASWQELVTVFNTNTGQIILSATVPYNAAALGVLNPGASAPRSADLHIPDGPAGIGNLLITVTVDTMNQVLEYNTSGTAESNNVASILRYSALAPYADLVPLAIQGPAQAIPGQTIQATWVVTNQGTATAKGPWSDSVLISPQSSGSNPVSLASVRYTNQLAVGQSLSVTSQVTVPLSLLGDQYLVVRVDNGGEVLEGTNENNNVGVALLPVHVLAPDLAVDSVTVPAPGVFGQSLAVTWVIRNSGDGTASTAWNDQLYLSNRTTAAVLPLGPTFPRPISLAAGAAYTNTQSVTLPLSHSILAGLYSILVAADVGNSVREINENNNLGASAPFQAAPPALPDLAIAEIRSPSAGIVGQPIQVSWVTTNQDAAPASGIWTESVYLFPTAQAQSGLLLASFNYTNTLLNGASLIRTQTVTLPPSAFGTRYLAVMADSSDTVFESVETNNLLVSLQSVEIAVPDLTVESLTVQPNPAIFSQTVNVTWVVRNNGTGPASAAWADYLALSRDAFLGGDWPLGTNNSLRVLAAGQSYTNTATVPLPLSGALAPGDYYILVLADLNNAQVESSKNNNSRAAAVSLAFPPLPDLVVRDIRLPANAPMEQPLTLSWAVSNQGPAQASGNWTETVALATDAAGNGLQSLATFRFTNTIGSGTALVRTQQVALPAGVFGTRYVIVTTDSGNAVVEGQENNNTTVSSQSLLIRAPDLVVESVTTSGNPQFGRTLDVTWTVRNLGGAPASAAWYDRVVFSAGLSLDNARVLLPQVAGQVLAPGAAYTRTQTLTLPLDHALTAGNFYLLVTTDAGSSQIEENESNNTSNSLALAVTYPPLPDLVATNVQAPANAVAGFPTPISWAITNLGAATANGPWNERLWACDDATGTNPQMLATFTYSSRLLAGEGLIRTQRVMLPVEWKGTRYFKVATDVDDGVFESNESNNTALATQPTAISTPDLHLASVSISPDHALFGDQVHVTWVVQNQGDGAANSSWSDRLVFSVDGTWGSGAILATQPAFSTLAPGHSYTNFTVVTLPLTASSVAGTCHVLVMADVNNVLAESSEANNVGDGVVTLSLPALPDLAVTNVQILDTNGLSVAQLMPGASALLVWTTTNRGTTDAIGPWSEAVSVTTNATGTTGVGAGNFRSTNTIAAGGFLVHTQAVTVPPNSPIGPVYWVVGADSQNVIIESDEANNAGVSATSVNVAAVLTLQLTSITLYEGASVAATVTRNGDFSQALTVTVGNSDPARMNAPATVAIPAGQASASFNLIGIADGIVDGNQMVTVSVSADTYSPAQGSLTVVDTDVPRLTLAFATNTMVEGLTLATTVSVSAAPVHDLSVAVFSSRSSRLAVPGTVIIPAGQTSVTFAVLAVDNPAVELPVTVTVSVTASGNAAATGTLTVLDNDTPDLTLTLDRQSVNEGDGPAAAYATLRNAKTSTVPLVIALESSLPALVRVPAIVTMASNENAVSFPVGVLDDADTNGTRSVSIRAIPTTTYGNTHLGLSVGTSLIVYDNEGPTLKLAFDRVITPFSANPAAHGTVTRSGSVGTPLVVRLTSGDTNELLAPAQVTIAAGQTNATFAVVSLNDFQPGSASVTVTADADGYNGGSARLVVTHEALPDLAISEVTAPTDVVGGDLATVSFHVVNQGLFPAIGSWVQQVFLATNPVLDASSTPLGQFPFTGSLSAGQSIGQALTFYTPIQPGQYWVIVAADATNGIAELLEDNNTQIAPQPLTVAPSYSATVQCDLNHALVGTPIPLHGVARRPNGQVVAYDVVNVYVQTRNTTRTLTVLTDVNGQFQTTFQPLPGEGGSYSVCAAAPNALIPPPQDSFVLVGMQASENPLARRFNALSIVSGQFQLQNLSDVALSGLTATVQGLPSGLEVSVNVTPDLPGSGSVPVQFQMQSLQDETASSAFSVLFRSAEGAEFSLPVYVMVDALRPLLAVTPSSFQLGLVRGQQHLETLQVVNTGGAASEPLALSLPDLPWMTVASVNPIPALQPGETNQFLLQFTPPPDQPLSEFNGSFAVAGGTVSANVPFHVKIVSSALGNLKFTTVDEATYYGANQTNFGGVHVVLRDPFNNEIVAQGQSGADGILWFTDLREGTYNLEATAPKHDTTTMTVSVKPGLDNEVTVFLRTQLVRYTWNVEEIEIEDHYKITISTVFETYVPTPVVTVEPTVLDLATVQGDEGQFMLTMTNHGLVAANNVKLRFDSHPDWELIPLVSDVGVLPARSGLTVPVTARRITHAGAMVAGGGKQAKSPGAPCSISAGVDWLLLCGPFGITYNVPILVVNASGDCGSISTSGPGGGGVWPGWGGPGGGPGTGPSFSPVTPSYASSNSCACDAATFTAKCVTGKTGVDANLDAAINAVKAAMPPWAKLSSLKLSMSLSGQVCDCCENAVRGIKASVNGGVTGEAVVVIGFSSSIPDLEATVDPIGKVVMKASVMAGVEIKATGSLNANVTTKCFLKDPKACVTGSLGASGFVGVKGNATFSGTYDGQTLSASADAVAGVQAGFTISVSGCNDGKGIVAKVCADDVVLKLTATGTLKYKVGGSDVSTAVTLGTNMVLQKGGCWPASPIPVPFGDELTPDKIAQMTGFSSAHDMAAAQAAASAPQAALFGGNSKSLNSGATPTYTYAWTAPQPAPADRVVPPGAVAHAKKSGDGVCAQVKLELDQQASLTRKAIAATLDVINDADTTAIDDLTVTVNIYDPDGNLANDKFYILPPTLTAITDLTQGNSDSNNITVNSTAWHIEPATTGSARWVILPLDEAAINGPTVYRVGGFMSYTAGGVPGSATFTPAPVTVYPNARLVLNYFHQRDVYSDDPFTPEVEPSVPYNLAVMVNNIGHGQAKNFKIASAQPKIVENLKGLLIDFKIIATEVSGQALSPGLTADFGNIEPGHIKIGRWLMKSTLQGLFVEYSATFEHEDALGGKATSLIESVDIHEMTRLVYAPGALSDGLPDFLVHDGTDPNNILDLPDTLYLSDGTTNPVSVVTDGLISGSLGPANLSVTLTTTLPSGWTYLRIPDPSDGNLILRRIVRSDGIEISVNTNAWTTDRTFIGLGKPPIREHILHLLDVDSPGQYTLYYDLPPVPDTVPPTSQMGSLPASSSTQIPLSWSGSDDVSGVAAYDIYVSVNGGPFLAWLSQTAHNSAVYAGQGGNHYAFYVTATDNAGNREAPHAAPDAETTVDKSNHAPAFGATPDIAIDENTTLALDITATDPDASDTLSYSLLAGPAGLQYDALTGHMTWVTGESTGPSTNRITVVVQDNGVPPLSVTNSFNVVVREVNSPPTLAALSNRKINEGQTLTFLALANDGDIPAQTLTFRLGANAPAGAGIDPVTGLFSWRPSNLQGGTNYPISVIAADNGVPSLSATQTFLVTVRDIVADLSLQVGNTNLYVGETNKVPFLLSSGLDLKQVAFTLQQDPVRLSGFWVTDLPAQVFSADITAGASNQARITFTARTNETLQGLLALGRLQFSTDTNPHSAIVSLSISNLAGVRTDDTLFDRGMGGLSRVFVVGREPILDLQKGGLLRLYGQAGTNYDVLASGNLGPQAHWSLVKHLTLQGRWQDLSQPLTNQLGLFYCARQVPPESLGVSTVDPGHFRLDLRGMLGAAYRIETKTSLPDLWQPVISFTLSNSPKSLNWTNHGEPVRYFRAVRE